jgi:hypothetical protein
MSVRTPMLTTSSESWAKTAGYDSNAVVIIAALSGLANMRFSLSGSAAVD